MKSLTVLSVCLEFAIGISSQAHAVIFLDTADPTHNTTTPGDNSGWQYEGKFIYFLGVPIGPYHFITAKHFGGTVGVDNFNFHGDIYNTIDKHPISGTDLIVWEVDHAKPFPTYAPLYTGSDEDDKSITVMGRGTLRELNPWIVGSDAIGWKWGASSDVQRWGRNVIDGLVNGGPNYGTLFYCDFNNPGVANECHLSTGDSGGGWFILKDGLWRLAGITLSVDGPFRVPATESSPAGPTTYAALHNARGLEYLVSNNPDVWAAVPLPDPDLGQDIPSSFYGTPISAHLHRSYPQKGILDITGGDGSLAPESYSAWQKLYFTPTQILIPATTGTLADFDADGISNLLEFALNTEPIFNARTTMTAATGLSGLPLVRLENISGSDHVTIEFVRRTAGSGSGLTYTPQFSSNLTTWEEVGTETVTAINPRWERVKVVDPETTGSATKRLARLKVTLAP